MTLHALIASRLVADILGICARVGMVLGRVQDIEDRTHRAQRELMAASEGPEAALVNHLRECPTCTAGPGCEMAREIAEFCIPTPGKAFVEAT